MATAAAAGDRRMAGVPLRLTVELSPAQLEAVAARVAEMLAEAAGAAGADGVRDGGALTVAEAARRAGVSERTIRRAVADGRLPAVRLPGVRSVRVPAAEVEAWAAPAAAGPAAAGGGRPAGRRVLGDALGRAGGA